MVFGDARIRRARTHACTGVPRRRRFGVHAMHGFGVHAMHGFGVHATHGFGVHATHGFGVHATHGFGVHATRELGVHATRERRANAGAALVDDECSRACDAKALASRSQYRDASRSPKGRIHMNKHISSLFVAAAIGFVGLAPAHADECKKVDIQVKNNKPSTKVKALKVEYKFTNDNTWRTESFSNVEVSAGALKTVASNQNLAGGEGNKLVSMKLHFQAYCGGKWSQTYVATDSAFDDDSKCQSNSNRAYRFDLAATAGCDN
jgi:hypothetical protein